MSSFFNKKVLSNNPLLYATAIISFLNILGFIQIGKMNIVLLYMTLALLLSVYTKNMVVVLGAPLILSNLVSYMDPTREGFTEEDEVDEDEELEDENEELEDEDEELEDEDDEIEGDEEVEDEDDEIEDEIEDEDEDEKVEKVEKGLTDNLNDSMNELNKKIEELGKLQLGNLVSNSEE